MKPRFAALDGLRGVAALGVLLYHAADWSGRPGVFAHGYLAVDFFFCLSGFVLAHAFQEREIGWGGYLWIRVVRIWPMVVLSMLIGALLSARVNPTLWPDLLRGLLLIPRLVAHDVGVFPSLFPLNPPAWSLCFEILVSALWFPLRRLPTLGLTMIVVVSGLLMLWVSTGMGGVQSGWDQDTLWIGVTRATYSFSLGWACWRCRALAPKPRLIVPVVVLMAVLVSPVTGWNGVFDFACITLLFPLLVLMGAHDPKGAAGRLCRWAGEVSYPLYILHWAGWSVMISLFLHGWTQRLPVWFAALAVVLLPLVGALVFRVYDAPVRAALTRLGRRVGL